MSDQLPYWLAAAHVVNMTPGQFAQCLQVFPTISSLFLASQEEWKLCGLTPAQIQSLRFPDWQEVEASLKWAQKETHHLVTLDDPRYPALLKEISDPPLVLFIKGDASILSQQQIAMVGARRITVYGEKHAMAFAASLARAGLVITSGLARGVDAVSHRGTLNAAGRTIAVTGTGLLITYPANHNRLADEIVACGGALVSEFPLSALPQAYHFPRRNRIISGLSCGVLVVEAAVESGSLITARHAAEQGREVFAIPGPIQSPVSRGCHALIRQGAKLVESPEDILEEFGLNNPVEFSPPLAIMPPTLNSVEQKIYDHIGPSVASQDEIILRSGLTAGAVSSILLSLELRGYIRAVTGGYVR